MYIHWYICALQLKFILKLKKAVRENTGEKELPGPHGVHPFQVPCNAAQTPLSPNGLKPSEQKLAKAHHRFEGLLQQGVGVVYICITLNIL